MPWHKTYFELKDIGKQQTQKKFSLYCLKQETNSPSPETDLSARRQHRRNLQKTSCEYFPRVSTFPPGAAVGAWNPPLSYRFSAKLLLFVEDGTEAGVLSQSAFKLLFWDFPMWCPLLALYNVFLLLTCLYVKESQLEASHGWGPCCLTYKVKQGGHTLRHLALSPVSQFPSIPYTLNHPLTSEPALRPCTWTL